MWDMDYNVQQSIKVNPRAKISDFYDNINPELLLIYSGERYFLSVWNVFCWLLSLEINPCSFIRLNLKKLFYFFFLIFFYFTDSLITLNWSNNIFLGLISPNSLLAVYKNIYVDNIVFRMNHISASE